MAADTDITDPATLRYGVAGDPVTHSRSPRIHAAAYAELGIGADYQLLPIPAELFAETVRALRGSGFRGINVTIPHKQAALAVADTASPAARAIGAANTLTFADERIRADNTDAPGMVAALPIPPAGERALVLGAGGTARAAIWALADAGAEVFVWNRTAERAQSLAGELDVSAVPVPAAVEAPSIVVNTTSVGMGAEQTETVVLESLRLDLDALSDDAVVVDFVYRPGGSPLTTAARARGLRVVDGDELLVRQAALSFEIWFGRPAPLAAMRAAHGRID